MKSQGIRIGEVEWCNRIRAPPAKTRWQPGHHHARHTPEVQKVRADDRLRGAGVEDQPELGFSDRAHDGRGDENKVPAWIERELAHRYQSGSSGARMTPVK